MACLLSGERMAEAMPDRVSIEAGSPFFRRDFKRVGVKFEGRVIFNCAEFCVSEGWARLWVANTRGQFKRERGQIVTVTARGKVEPYWR